MDNAALNNETCVRRHMFKDYLWDGSGNPLGDFGCLLDDTYRNLNEDQFVSVSRVIFGFMKNYLKAKSDRKKLKIRDKACNILNDLHDKYCVVNRRAIDVLQSVLKVNEFMKGLIPIMYLYFEDKQ